MHPSAARRIRYLAGGLLIVTFAAGCLVGAASARVLNAREPGDAAPVSVTPTARTEQPASPHGVLIDPGVLEAIGVTVAQRVLIDSILNLREHDTKLLWREWEPRFDAIVQEARGQVRAQLREDQVEEFDALIAQRRPVPMHGGSPQPRALPKPKGDKPNHQSPNDDTRDGAPRRFESVALQ